MFLAVHYINHKKITVKHDDCLPKSLSSQRSARLLAKLSKTFECGRKEERKVVHKIVLGPAPIFFSGRRRFRRRRRHSRQCECTCSLSYQSVSLVTASYTYGRGNKGRRIDAHTAPLSFFRNCALFCNGCNISYLLFLANCTSDP
jgi:hypothetical protein